MDIQKELELTVKSNIDNIEWVGVSIRAISELSGFGENVSYEIELALVEALNNCVEHAYQNQPDKEIKILISFDGKKIIFKIFDQGKSIPEDKFKKAGEPELEDLLEGGRGLYLIRDIMDQIYYFTDKNINCLILEKSISE